jgi:hypothetical protein
MNVGNIAFMTGIAQETMETAAQTKAEAVKGDQQAIRKLASAQTANNTQNAQQPAEKDSTRGLNLLA